MFVAGFVVAINLVLLAATVLKFAGFAMGAAGVVCTDCTLFLLQPLLGYCGVTLCTDCGRTLSLRMGAVFCC